MLFRSREQRLTGSCGSSPESPKSILHITRQGKIKILNGKYSFYSFHPIPGLPKFLPGGTSVTNFFFTYPGVFFASIRDCVCTHGIHIVCIVLLLLNPSWNSFFSIMTQRVSSFLFKVAEYFIVWMFCALFNHSSLYGYLCYFHFFLL